MKYFVPTILIEVEEASNTFYTNIFKLYGLPKSFTSDRGTQFTSKVWDHLYKNLRIDTKLSTAYHP